jgi:endonuclease III
MKNATKHAEDLRSLFKRLNKEAKPVPLQTLDPLQALVRGAMSFDVSDSRADDAMKAIEKEFVDLNELRVATDLEIAELLGVRYPAIEKRVELITRALNAIFEKEHTLKLERLATVSKRDARTFLRELPDMHPFVEAFVMLFALEGAAIPVDQEIVGFLVEEEVVEETATLADVQRFLEHNLKAEEYYDFYTCVRRAAHNEAERGRKKAKVKAK